MNNNHEKYMQRCIELAESAMSTGELPYGSLIVKDGKIIAEAQQEVKAKNDVTQHAEIIAMCNAQKILTADELKECTIYCSDEPCPMCAFMIRELKLKRIVFARPVPTTGGYTKWHILQDEELNMALPKYFGEPPEVIGGVLEKEAQEVWRRREELKKRGSII